MKKNIFEQIAINNFHNNNNRDEFIYRKLYKVALVPTYLIIQGKASAYKNIIYNGKVIRESMNFSGNNDENTNK